MSYFVYHRYGASERDPPATVFPLLLAELTERSEDQEHTSVSVIHESEWGLSFYRDGYVVFENVEGDGEPRHMRNIPHERLLDLMQTLAMGDLTAIEQEPWKPGY